MSKVEEIKLTQKELHEIFNYDTLTGTLIWKKPIGIKMKVGDIAGCLDKSTGYCVVYYNKRKYRMHRLIWIYVHGYIPKGKLIDHKDRNKSNNKLSNLRLCTYSENDRNKSVSKNSISKIKGVSYLKLTGKYRVRITNPLKRVREYYHGFNSAEEAEIFYENKAAEYYGEFHTNSSN